MVGWYHHKPPDDYRQMGQIMTVQWETYTPWVDRPEHQITYEDNTWEAYVPNLAHVDQVNGRQDRGAVEVDFMEDGTKVYPQPEDSVFQRSLMADVEAGEWRLPSVPVITCPNCHTELPEEDLCITCLDEVIFDDDRGPAVGACHECLIGDVWSHSGADSVCDPCYAEAVAEITHYYGETAPQAARV